MSMDLVKKIVEQQGIGMEERLWFGTAKLKNDTWTLQVQKFGCLQPKIVVNSTIVQTSTHTTTHPSMNQTFFLYPGPGSSIFT
jgi:hypothetical protein